MVGDLIAGKYTLVRVIGEGGMGVVFEALHVRLQQRLAIKVLHPKVAEAAGGVSRFEREARTVAQLRGVNIARIVDVDALPNGLPYMVLEYLEGRDLGVELEANGPLPVEAAVDYVLQAATAMIEAHDLGIVHRDLKPSNLFALPIGVGSRKLIKVLDFGISKTRADGDTHHLTTASSFLGTPHYMSPEQLRETREVDARSDIWSLGVILFELLTGRTPFEGSPTAIVFAVAADPVPRPSTHRPDLPPSLDRAVMRMLEKDRDRRGQTMTEVIDMLAPFGPKELIADLVAKAPRPAGRIGEILVRERLIKQEELDRALEIQRRTKRLLGRVLVEIGAISEADLMVAIAQQQQIGEVPHAPAQARGRGRIAAAATAAAVVGIGLAAWFGVFAPRAHATMLPMSSAVLFAVAQGAIGPTPDATSSQVAPLSVASAPPPEPPPATPTPPAAPTQPPREPLVAPDAPLTSTAPAPSSSPN